MRLQLALAVLVTVLLGAPDTARATLLTGPFVACEQPTETVGVNGLDLLFADGTTHPVPIELQPAGDWSLHRVPAGDFLYAIRATATGACPGGTQVSFFAIPAADGDPLVLVRHDLCLQDGRAWECFYEQPSSSQTQDLAGIGQTSSGGPTQRITWVDLDTGTDSTTTLQHQIETSTLRLSPSGTHALVHHDIGDSFGSDWSFVDLCPGSLGTVLTTYQNLGAGGTAALSEPTAGSYQVDFSHPGLLGGGDSFATVDCLGGGPADRTLQVATTGAGAGTVSDSTGSIDCASSGSPGDCSESYPDGTAVTLTASPAPGSRFTEWSGDCTGSSPVVTLSLIADATCVASFDLDSADLAVTLALATDPAVAGLPLDYAVTIGNDGPAVATNVSASISLDDAISFEAAASSPECTQTAGGVRCTPTGDLVAGAAAVFTVVGTVEPSARGDLTTQASVFGLPADPDGGDNSASETTAVEGRVDLHVAKTAVAATVPPGGLAAFRVEVDNQGPSAALTVDLVDALPAGLEPFTAAGSANLTCSAGPLAAGSRSVVPVLARVRSDQTPGAVLTNSVSATPAEIELAPADNTDTAALTVASPSPPAPGAPVVVLTTGDPLPGGDTVSGRIQPPVVRADGTALISAEVNPATSRGSMLVWTGADLAMLAESGAPAPGAGAVHLLPGWATSDGQELVFISYLDDLMAGLYRFSGCGLEPLLPPGRDSLFYPSVDGDEIALPYDPWDNADGEYGIWRVSAGLASAVVTRGVQMPGSSFAMTDFANRVHLKNDDIVFFAADLPAGGGSASWAGIFVSRAGGSPELVADLATVPPNAPGDTFLSFGQRPRLLDDGSVVFSGRYAPGRDGLYRADLTSGSLITLVDETTPTTDGGAPVEWILPTAALATDSGRIAFVASDATMISGVFLWQSGTVSRLATAGDTYAGKIATSFELAPDSLSGGVLGVSVGHGIFTSDTTAVLLPVPEATVFGDGFESGDATAWSAAHGS